MNLNNEIRPLSIAEHFEGYDTIDTNPENVMAVREVVVKMTDPRKFYKALAKAMRKSWKRRHGGKRYRIERRQIDRQKRKRIKVQCLACGHKYSLRRKDMSRMLFCPRCSSYNSLDQLVAFFHAEGGDRE